MKHSFTNFLRHVGNGQYVLAQRHGRSVGRRLGLSLNGFYNPRWRHSAQGWKSPVAFEHKVA